MNFFGPLECKFMALLKITNFWSNLLEWGYQHTFQFYGSVGPLECKFLEQFVRMGVPDQFSHTGDTRAFFPYTGFILCFHMVV